MASTPNTPSTTGPTQQAPTEAVARIKYAVMSAYQAKRTDLANRLLDVVRGFFHKDVAPTIERCRPAETGGASDPSDQGLLMSGGHVSAVQNHLALACGWLEECAAALRRVGDAAFGRDEFRASVDMARAYYSKQAESGGGGGGIGR